MAPDHENMIQLGYGQAAGSPAPEVTLAAAIAGLGPVPPATLRPLGSGLARALAVIHASGRVHGGLNPHSVFLGVDGPRVASPGSTPAAVRPAAGPEVGMDGATGATGFLSPEQVAHGAVGFACDVFSLACVLAYAATGHAPFGDGPAVAVMYRLMNGAPQLEAVPEPFAELLAACLAKDPAERPTLAEILARLTPQDPAVDLWPSPQIAALAAQSASPGEAGTPVDGEQTGGHRVRRRALIAGVIAAAIAIPVGIELAVSGGGSSSNDGGGTSRPPGTAGRVVAFTPVATLVAETTVNDPCVFAFSPQAGALMTAAGSENKSASSDATALVLRWDLASHKRNGAISLTDTIAVNRLRYSRDGRYVAAACTTLGGDLGIDMVGTVWIWDAGSLKNVATLRRAPEDPASLFAMGDVAFSPDGTLLAGAQSGSHCIGKVPVWDVAAQSLLKLLVVGAGAGSSISAVHSVAFSPDGTKLAAGWGDGATSGVTVWNTSSFRRIGSWHMAGDGFGTASIAFSPDGTLIAASFGGVALWDASSFALVSTLTPSTGPDSQGIAFSPDGSLLAATWGAGRTGQLTLWDTRTHHHLISVETGSASDPAFSPDGTQIAVSAANAKAQPVVQLWKVS